MCSKLYKKEDKVHGSKGLNHFLAQPNCMTQNELRMGQGNCSPGPMAIRGGGTSRLQKGLNNDQT